MAVVPPFAPGIYKHSTLDSAGTRLPSFPPRPLLCISFCSSVKTWSVSSDSAGILMCWGRITYIFGLWGCLCRYKERKQRCHCKDNLGCGDLLFGSGCKRSSKVNHSLVDVDFVAGVVVGAGALATKISSFGAPSHLLASLLTLIDKTRFKLKWFVYSTSHSSIESVKILDLSITQSLTFIIFAKSLLNTSFLLKQINK